LQKACAGLYGSPWLAQLKANCDITKLPLEQQQALTALSGEIKYQPQSKLDKKNIIAVCKYWIKNHPHKAVNVMPTEAV